MTFMISKWRKIICFVKAEASKLSSRGMICSGWEVMVGREGLEEGGGRVQAGARLQELAVFSYIWLRLRERECQPVPSYFLGEHRPLLLLRWNRKCLVASLFLTSQVFPGIAARAPASRWLTHDRCVMPPGSVFPPVLTQSFEPGKFTKRLVVRWSEYHMSRAGQSRKYPEKLADVSWKVVWAWWQGSECPSISMTINTVQWPTSSAADCLLIMGPSRRELKLKWEEGPS